MTSSGPRAAALAALGYVALTLVMTWPLALGLTRDVPADHGDSLLNMWILGWGAESVIGMLTGASSFRDWWNAGIFHPSPLALAYSEHLFALVIQVLPVYLATENLILGYNLLFLSTFVLSGLGMYLLVTDLTGSRVAGFVAGLFYAFTPYRIVQLPHLQVLASQWMPFVLYGFRRFLATRRWQPLAGGSAALVMQNLSCGYYLLFFAPIAPAFAVVEMARRGLLRDMRVWASFAVAGAAVAAVTLPFLFPYMELRALEGFERHLAEIEGYSPDLYGYVTGHESLRLLGAVMRAAPMAEGELFLGLTPMALAVVALAWPAAAMARAWRAAPPVAASRLTAVRALVVVAALAAAAILYLTFVGRVRGEVFGIGLRMTDGERPLALLLLASAGLLALAPRARAALGAFATSPVMATWAFLGFSVVMSLGPTPARGGAALDLPAIYALFLDYVPGFDGLRVPGRYAMIAAIFLAMAAAWPLAALAARGRAGVALVAVIGALFLAEATAVPIEINRMWGEGAYRDAPRVLPGPEAPPLYRYLAEGPRDRIVMELPFGDVGWDLRAVYYASVHKLRLVNGYSGGFPRDYRQRQSRLDVLVDRPGPAWEMIATSGATHVVLHEQAYWGDRSERVKAFLETHGATLERDFGEGELLYRVR